MPGPAPIIVPAKAVQTAVVIFLHGLGDTGMGWKPVRVNCELVNLSFIRVFVADRLKTLNHGTATTVPTND
jgi:hypothetical protein